MQRNLEECVLYELKTKLHLLYLQFLLSTTNAFNAAFQATSYSTILQFYPEINKL